MKTLAFALTAALVVVAADGPSEEQIAAELKLLEGTWKIESIEIDGRKLDVAGLKDITRTVEGHEITWRQKDQVIARTKIEFDPTRDPKSMDTTFVDGENKDRTMLSIYEIEGDEFRICAAAFDRVRPTEFASPPGSGTWLFTCKRVEPAK